MPGAIYRIDPLFDPHANKSLIASNATHSRYKFSFHRSLRQLRNLQTNRVVQNLLPKPLFQGGLPALVKVKATEIIALAKRTTKQFLSLALNSLIAVTQSRSTCNNAQPPGCRKDSLEGALREKEIAWHTRYPTPFAHATSVPKPVHSHPCFFFYLVTPVSSIRYTIPDGWILHHHHILSARPAIFCG